MWQSSTVERALFKWNKWRSSILVGWVEWDDKVTEKENIDELEVDKALFEMKLPDLELLRVYWIACLKSKYNFNYPKSFCNIMIKAGQHFGDFEINQGSRIYPPQVVTKGDLEFEARKRGLDFETLKQLCSGSYSPNLLLPSEHDLLILLGKMKGRPTTHIKRGPLPWYPDRLAVRCASLRKSGLSYVEIATKLELPITRPWSSNQSDVALYLTTRGNRLLNELS